MRNPAPAYLTAKNTGSDATISATMPRLVANAQIASPIVTPSAVNTPVLRPPIRVLRIVSAVSGPGVMRMKIETPRNASSVASIVSVLSLKVALPRLADQIDAERMVRLLGDLLEAGLGVDRARGGENALGPQRHAPIARVLGKA